MPRVVSSNPADGILLILSSILAYPPLARNTFERAVNPQNIHPSIILSCKITEIAKRVTNFFSEVTRRHKHTSSSTALKILIYSWNAAPMRKDIISCITPEKHSKWLKSKCSRRPCLIFSVTVQLNKTNKTDENLRALSLQSLLNVYVSII